MSNPQFLESKNSCDVIRNKITDIIILVTVPFGIVAIFFEMYRDYLFGFTYWFEFAVFNVFSVLIALIIYLYRRKISLDVKITVLSFGFFLAGVLALIKFGSLSNTYILITISLLILQLRVSRNWMLILILVTPLMLIAVGSSIQFNPLINDLD